jgi:hypothetical protein
MTNIQIFPDIGMFHLHELQWICIVSCEIVKKVNTEIKIFQM